MTPKEAKQVIEVLAGGIDPETGEVLPEDSPINNPHVIRALFIAAKALDLLADKPVRPAKAGPSNAGKPWTDDEVQRLAASFDAGMDVATLAKTHQRTLGAITARLVRLGRVEPGGSASS